MKETLNYSYNLSNDVLMFFLLYLKDPVIQDSHLGGNKLYAENVVKELYLRY